MSEPNPRRFSVALSFSGEERIYIASVAKRLLKHFGQGKIFYDEYFKAELARIDLDVYLQNIYEHESDLLVLFFSDSYTEKRWCGLEWRAIRSLIGQRSSHIIPVKLGDAPPPEGLFDTDGYLSGLETPARQLSQEIIKRYDAEFSHDAGDTLGETNLDEEDTRTIELVLDMDFGDFGPEEDKALINALKALLDGDYEVKILKKKPGSVKVLINADTELADEIVRTASSGSIGEFEVIKCSDDLHASPFIQFGGRWRKVLKAVFSRKRYSLTFDPIIADIEEDYFEFLAEGNTPSLAKLKLYLCYHILSAAIAILFENLTQPLVKTWRFLTRT